jgi:preprotein translocase subunit SecG
MLSIFINILLALNVIVCLLLILLTLMQRPKNEGLGAAFGGGMTDNLFGAQTSNVLAQATRVLGTAFFVITLLLSVLYTRLATSPSSVQAQLASKPVPAAPAAKPGEGQPATVDTDVKAAIEAKLKEAAAKAKATPATPEAPATPAK